MNLVTRMKEKKGGGGGGERDRQPDSQGGRETYSRLEIREGEIGGLNGTRENFSFFFLSPTRVAT